MQDLSWSTVPPSEKQTGHSRGHQGHGRQVGTFGLPHAPLRNEIRGPRSGVLRGPTPSKTDQTPQVESLQAWIPDHPSSGGLEAEAREFLERIIGCDLHARQQTLAMLDTTTGEVVKLTLTHEGDNVREFYSSLPHPVRVGIEATGS